MNHRQWKKNFKKSHGRNPSCWEDKRKKIRYDARKMSDALAEIPRIMAEAYGTLFRGLSVACEVASKTFWEIADSCTSKEENNR